MTHIDDTLLLSSPVHLFNTLHLIYNKDVSGAMSTTAWEISSKSSMFYCSCSFSYNTFTSAYMCLTTPLYHQRFVWRYYSPLWYIQCHIGRLVCSFISFESYIRPDVLFQAIHICTCHFSSKHVAVKWRTQGYVPANGFWLANVTNSIFSFWIFDVMFPIPCPGIKTISYSTLNPLLQWYHWKF